MAWPRGLQVLLYSMLVLYERRDYVKAVTGPDSSEPDNLS